MKNELITATKNVASALARHKPRILLWAGVGGLLSAGVWGVTATPAAQKAIANKKKEVKHEKLTPVETIDAVWKCYAGPVALSMISVAGIAMGDRALNKQQKALMAAYSISEAALSTYQAKTLEAVGEEKEQDIRDAVVRAKGEDAKKLLQNEQIVYTGKGDTLCYDAVTGRLFMSSVDVIRQAVHKINDRLYGDMCVSLNDFYDEINLGRVEVGDMLGWNIDKGFIQMDLGSHLVDDKPVVTIDYKVYLNYDHFA